MQTQHAGKKKKKKEKKKLQSKLYILRFSLFHCLAFLPRHALNVREKITGTCKIVQESGVYLRAL